MRNRELVIIPTPGMGHLLPTVELAKLLINHHNISVIILIINNPLDSFSVNAFVDSQSRDSDSSRLTFHTLPTPSNTPDRNSPSFSTALVELHKPLIMQALLYRVRSGSPKPAGLILDMFCTTIIEVADDLNIPSYIYFTSGACLLNLALYFHSLVYEQGLDLRTQISSPDIELDIPGFINRVPSKVVPGLFSQKDAFNVFLNHINRFKKTKGILVNTFMEMESHVMQELVDQHEKQKIPGIYPVGPILSLDSKTRGGSESRKEDEKSIMKWLDEQPVSSVVFLCFGSMGSFGKEQVKEIAMALEGAGHRFLWSLRKPPSENNLFPSENETFEEGLPEGFLDRMNHLGKVIGWAPQVSILGHRAVGGFVSHCGWNSTLESFWFGVPMATWPLYAEQQLNAFQLVKELGLAVEIRMDYRCDLRKKEYNFLVKAEEIENGVRKLMSMDEETKQRVMRMSEHGKKAIEDGGSSFQWLSRFINDVINNAKFDSQ